MRTDKPPVPSTSCPPCSRDNPCPHVCPPCGPTEGLVLRSFDEVVDNYISQHRKPLADQRKCWTLYTSKTCAIWRAAASTLPCERRHPHQYRIPATTLGKAANRLCRTSFPVNGTFHDLYKTVCDEIKRIKGIGPLAVYDIANRIGSIHGLAPDRVYLHAKPLQTARRLGIAGAVVPVCRFPEAFHRLQPYEIEDCLCVYFQQIISLCKDSNHTDFDPGND